MTKTLKQYCVFNHPHEQSCQVEIKDVKEWLMQKRQEQCARRPFIMTLKVDMIDELLKELGQ